MVNSEKIMEAHERIKSHATKFGFSNGELVRRTDHRYERLRTTNQVVIHGDRKDRCTIVTGLFFSGPVREREPIRDAFRATVPDRRRRGEREKLTDARLLSAALV
jgi:hypothetical protein